MFKYPANVFRNFLFNDDPPCHGINRTIAESGLRNIASSLRWRFRRSLSLDFVEILNIYVLDLDLSDKLPSAPVYFEHMTTAEIQAHPIVNDKESQEYLAQFDQTLKKIAAGESGMDGLQIAETFAARLRHELCGFNRVGINKIKGKNLLALTDFHYKELVSSIHPPVSDTLALMLFQQEVPAFRHPQALLPHRVSQGRISHRSRGRVV